MQVSKNEDKLLAAKEEEATLKIILFWNSFFGAFWPFWPRTETFD